MLPLLPGKTEAGSTASIYKTRGIRAFATCCPFFICRGGGAAGAFQIDEKTMQMFCFHEGKKTPLYLRGFGQRLAVDRRKKSEIFSSDGQ